LAYAGVTFVIDDCQLPMPESNLGYSSVGIRQSQIENDQAAEITPPGNNASSITKRLASVPSPDIHPTPFR
jgi:hypothetical protein